VVLCTDWNVFTRSEVDEGVAYPTNVKPIAIPKVFSIVASTLGPIASPVLTPNAKPMFNPVMQPKLLPVLMPVSFPIGESIATPGVKSIVFPVPLPAVTPTMQSSELFRQPPGGVPAIEPLQFLRVCLERHRALLFMLGETRRHDTGISLA
jgi:hypothetical protein